MMAKRINTDSLEFVSQEDSALRKGFKDFIETDWGFLQDISKGWNEKPNKWKYTCSYCLFVNRKRYFTAGGFDELFDSYGYEDTELGYRLDKMNCSFHLLSQPVFHITQIRRGVSFVKNILNRRLRMQRSAQLFFLKHLDTQIFRELLWIWGGSTLESKLSKIYLNTCGLSYISKTASRRIASYFIHKTKNSSEVRIGK
jgi:hypothetical protein